MAGILRSLGRIKKLDSDDLVQTELKRCLGVADLTAIGVGSTLGAGIYVLAGQVAREEAGPAIVLSFLIAALVSLLSGICYAEFGARVPKTGSAYIYSYVTVGEFIAFVIGWSMIMDNVIAGASVGKAWSQYLDSLLNSTISNHIIDNVGVFKSSWFGDYPDFLAFVLLIVVTVIIAVGVKMSSFVMLFFTGLNLVVIAFIIVAGAFYVDGENWTGGQGFFPYGTSGVFAGAATCFYAFVGFDVIATSGEEAKNPSRSIPISIVLTLVICLLAYVSVSAVMTLMIPYDYLAPFAPLSEVFQQRGFPVGKYIVAVGSLLGLTSSMMGSIFPLPRIIYAMAKDGLLFGFLARVNPKSNVPVIATIVAGVLTAIMALIFNLEQLVEMMSIGTLMSYTLVAISVLLLRYQPRDVGLSKNEAKQFALRPIEEKTGLLGKDNENISTKYTESGSNNQEATDDTHNIAGTSGIQSPTVSNTTALDDPSITKIDESLLKKDLHGDKCPTSATPVGYGHAILSVIGLESLLKNESTGNDCSLCGTPSPQSYIYVLLSVVGLVIIFFSGSSLLIFGSEYVEEAQWWALALLCVFCVVVVCLIVIIDRQPQNKMELYYTVPFVPYLPVFSVFFNIYLTLKLSLPTWIRFFVWLAIGLLIYFFYGIRHSTERIGQRTQSTAETAEINVPYTSESEIPTEIGKDKAVEQVIDQTKEQ